MPTVCSGPKLSCQSPVPAHSNLKVSDNLKVCDTPRASLTLRLNAVTTEDTRAAPLSP